MVTATAKDLHEEVHKGVFRDDLYYRLAVVELRLPPLCELREDIPLLAQHFVERIARRERRAVPALSPEVLSRLQRHSWPGNVRELENFMEKTLIFQRGDHIELDALPGEALRRTPRSGQDFSLKEAVPSVEREYIRKALAATDGNRTRAAKLLEISLRALHYKLKELDLE